MSETWQCAVQNVELLTSSHQLDSSVAYSINFNHHGRINPWAKWARRKLRALRSEKLNVLEVQNPDTF